MPRNSFAKRRDRNHAEVVDRLRELGWYVIDTASVPGFFDGIAARAGAVHFIEIKDGSRPPSARKLTPAQVDLHGDFRRAGASIKVLMSVEDAEDLR